MSKRYRKMAELSVDCCTENLLTLVTESITGLVEKAPCFSEGMNEPIL